jgi:site-specific DNA recombinase
MRVRVIQPTKKAEVKKKRVCAYARVSTDNLNQGNSLENQIQYYEQMISDNPNYEFVGVFADKGITGTKANRPEFQRMLEAARQGQIDIIITKSISRFARNTAIMLSVSRELKDIGVEIIFEKENISTLSGDGELMLTVLSSFAQEESKNVSDNLKWRAREQFQRGEVMINTKRFYGYDKVKQGNLVINEKEAEIVRRIFNEYIGEKGVDSIAKDLNLDGVPTVGNKKWHDSTIRQMLRNEKYKGDALLQKYYSPDHLKRTSVKNKGVLDSYYIENNHPPIISKELWNEVQKKLKERAQAKGIEEETAKKYTVKYPLSRILYCSKCGATLKRRTWNSKLNCKKIVWQCSNYIRNGKQACAGTTIDDEIISRVNIKEPTVVEEVIRDGKKNYSYSSKEQYDKLGGEVRT